MAFDLLTAAIGALAGSGKDEQTTTAKSDPWGPAQPYMLRNLQDTEKLGNYYKQNPFNPQQIEGYSNLFGDNQNFRQNIAPGLMDFANRGMGSNYQRQRVARPGGVAGYGGTNPARQAMQAPSGPSGGLLGPFNVASGGTPSGGLLDLNGAQNPFANGGVKPNEQTVNEEMIDQLKQELGLGNSPGNDSGDNQPRSSGGGTNYGMNINAPELNPIMSLLSPSFVAAYNAMMRSGYDALPGSKESQAFGTPGWGAAVNAYADARGQRQAGVGMDGGGGQLGVGGDLGGGTYGGGGIDYGDW
jgi:hypothetical protein